MDNEPMSTEQKLRAVAESLNVLTGIHRDNEARTEALIKIVEAHEKERVRFYRAMRAALEAYLKNENGAGE